MPIQGIDVARYNLKSASNSYAEIQRQLDRYNKVFEAYANASPETQIRAASVMRQALDEYNSLKRQQEENTLKIYEAQSWVDYYNNNSGQVTSAPQNQLTQKVSLNEGMPVLETAAAEEVPVIITSTPGVLNNNAPATKVEANAIDTNTTMNVPINSVLASAASQNTVSPTSPIGVTNIISSQTPKFPNTTIGPTTNFNYSGTNYGAGSVATINNNNKWTTSPTRKVGKSFSNIVRTRLK